MKCKAELIGFSINDGLGVSVGNNVVLTGFNVFAKNRCNASVGCGEVAHDEEEFIDFSGCGKIQNSVKIGKPYGKDGNPVSEHRLASRDAVSHAKRVGEVDGCSIEKDDADI